MKTNCMSELMRCFLFFFFNILFSIVLSLATEFSVKNMVFSSRNAIRVFFLLPFFLLNQTKRWKKSCMSTLMIFFYIFFSNAMSLAKHFRYKLSYWVADTRFAFLFFFFLAWINLNDEHKLHVRTYEMSSFLFF